MRKIYYVKTKPLKLGGGLHRILDLLSYAYDGYHDILEPITVIRIVSSVSCCMQRYEHFYMYKYSYHDHYYF